MQRLPEPELMDEICQAKAYAEADFAAPHQAFMTQLKQIYPELPKSGHALDLGCGPGDITIRFAKALPHWKIDGLDAAAAMLHFGRQAIQTEQLGPQISLQQAYLPQDEAPRSQYDFIFSNSLLHHLANPSDLWRSLQKYSHENTSVFIMDLLRPQSQEQAKSFVDLYAQGEPEILRRDFYQSLLAAYSLDEVKTQLTQENLSHLSIQAISDRHWIVWGSILSLNHLLQGSFGDWNIS
jgi:ubiquinone/menaquinone biosynthesis C-methylase UbiE